MIEYFGTNPILAVYYGHTSFDANQYFEQPHEQGSLCKLISTTSKRIAGLEPATSTEARERIVLEIQWNEHILRDVDTSRSTQTE
jgi:hypothetical protein